MSFVEQDITCHACGKSFHKSYEKRMAKFCSKQCRLSFWRIENKEKLREWRKNWRVKNSEVARKNEALRMYGLRDRTKAELFSLFGDHCQRCGFADKRALQVDHINGGGTTYGLSGTNKTRIAGTRLYRKILSGEFPQEDFQLLCANCNWIKRTEKKEQKARLYV